MAEDVFKNVQLLKGISVKEFMDTMGFFSAATGMNCVDCHSAENDTLAEYAVDTPLKQTARKMILMVNMLNRGTFGGQRKVMLTGTSGQMMGKVLYQFNQGLLVIAGLWLGFTVLQMVFKIVTTGQFMNKDHSVAHILLRVALGFAMLIPYSPTGTTTGYTLLQGIVMQVTVQGVKLADQIWEYALDYLDNGGALWTRPTIQSGSQSSTGSKTLMSDTDLNNILGQSDPGIPPSMDNYTSISMIQKIVAMEACMVQSSINTANNNSSADTGSVVSSSNTTPLSIYEDAANYKFEFPGGPDNSSSDRNTDCGVVYWSALTKNVSSGTVNKICPASNSDSTVSSDNSACGYSHLALKEVIYDLLPAVKKYICQNSASTDKGAICNNVNADDTTDYMSDAMMSATLNYQNLITPLVNQDQLVKDSSAQNRLRFYSQARKDGWIMAGRYYWDLMRVEDSYDGLLAGISYSQYIPPLGSDTASYGFVGLSSDKSKDPTLKVVDGLLSRQDYIQTAKDQLYRFSGTSASGESSFPRV